MKIQQIRDMKTEDLKIALNENYEAIENLRFRHATGQLENYKSLTNTKRAIAKMKTILKERESKINENLNKVK